MYLFIIEKIYKNNIYREKIYKFILLLFSVILVVPSLSGLSFIGELTDTSVISPRIGAGVASWSINSYIYLTGGQTGNNKFDNLVAYSSDATTWTSYNSTTPW